MPNNNFSVLYKHIIHVENKNVGLKVGGTNIPLPNWGHMPPLPTTKYLVHNNGEGGGGDWYGTIKF